MSEDFRTDVDFSKLFTDPDGLIEDLAEVGQQVQEIHVGIAEEVNEHAVEVKDEILDEIGDDASSYEAYEHVREDLIELAAKMQVAGTALPEEKFMLVAECVRDITSIMAAIEYRHRGGVKK